MECYQILNLTQSLKKKRRRKRRGPGWGKLTFHRMKDNCLETCIHMSFTFQYQHLNLFLNQSNYGPVQHWRSISLTFPDGKCKWSSCSAPGKLSFQPVPSDELSGQQSLDVEHWHFMLLGHFLQRLPPQKSAMLLHTNLIADSSSLLSWDLWQKIFLCIWTHCLELTTTIPKKNSVLQLLKRNLR